MTGCVKRRSTFTTTVLVFLSLTTTPCSTRFGIPKSFYPSAGLAALLRHYRFDARDRPANFTHAIRLLELAVGALEAEVEGLLLQLDQLVAQFVCRLGAEIVRLGRGLGRSLGGLGSLCLLGLGRCLRFGGLPGRHRFSPAPVRATNFVAIESFAEPRRIASLAVARSTPSISNRMRPGLILATQYSGAPLPEPMRTSAGFLETGTSGKTRIQTRPARFMWRVMARRAASISRALSRSGSRALRPYSPKLS